MNTRFVERLVPTGLGIALALALSIVGTADARAHGTPGDRLHALSDYEDAKGGKENVTEVERRMVLRGQVPQVLGVATRATAARVVSSKKIALNALSNFEDARGGKENVTEAERRAILRRTAYRILGTSTMATETKSLRGEITEITPTFVEVRYARASGTIVRRTFAVTDATRMRAHLQRGDQVKIWFDPSIDIALSVRDLAPAGEEALHGANN